MSLPNYLAKIKSAGMYRFTFDKSQLPAADAETMRLVVGYSEKGPFNNPVYIDNKADFINLFGNINKRLEKKGVFFHRLALQALSAGPILALNLKPFEVETVDYISFDPNDSVIVSSTNPTLNVTDLYDRNRFWKIDVDQLPEKIGNAAKYISIAATDSKETSCSIFFRRSNPDSVKQYDSTIRDWYKNLGEDMPDYLEGYEDTNVKDYFAEVYVFRGEFTHKLIGEGGILEDYFDLDGSLKSNYKNTFNQPADVLEALAEDSNSNFIGVYRGSLLPYFTDLNGNYISLDLVFNSDKENHKMIMKLNDESIDSMFNQSTELNDYYFDYVDSLSPIYIKGYDYTTISKSSTADNILASSLGILTSEKGIFEALTNHVDSEYHYIVDTFSSCVGKKFGVKNNIAQVAKKKDNCLAIMNFPDMSYLFKNLNVPEQFNITNIDKFMNISMPGETDGASYCAFYTPLIFADGAVKTTVPSAALVSNNFMEKWNSRQPYYIVAGPNYGVMSYEGLVGPDYNYSRSDLDALESFGVNCMVYVPRKGTYINSNQTAKQKPVSALSKVHVRELVIYLQNEIENMMQSYQWELNTQTLRDTIKTKADTILERIKANGGVYDFVNVCDGTNNTPEIIDNEMIILDTSIEPARGAGKMVQRLTIHKTGGISALTK